jgi:major membrane immunogen (membrane-anchored lipoprotein)
MTDSRRDQLAEALESGYRAAQSFDDLADALLPTIDRMCAEAAAGALKPLEELLRHVAEVLDTAHRPHTARRLRAALEDQ